MRRMKVPPLREWGWIIVSGGTAVITEAGLRTLGLPRLSRLLGAPLRTKDRLPEVIDPRASTLTASERLRVRASLRITRHWPFGDTCLRQALVIGALLRRRSPDLVVGVAKIDGEVRAHAWLEIDSGRLDPLGAAAAYIPLTAVEPS